MSGDADTVITVTVPEADADIATDRMWQWGVQAVSEVSVGDRTVELTTSVGDDPAAIQRAVATLDPAWSHTTRRVDASVGQVAAEYLGPTWYAPGMVSVPAPIHPIDVSDDVMVTIVDAGSAFGLGDHPSTRSSMALLAACIARTDPTPGRLLDVGCGSGVLAVLAAQLGVAKVQAIDIADAAVEATRRTAALNGVGDRIVVDTTSIADVDGEFDVVVANILAPTLISMAADLTRLVRPGGSLIISGILAARHAHVVDALAPLQPTDSITDEGWITIELRRAVRHCGHVRRYEPR